MYYFADLERVIMNSFTPTIRVKGATPIYNIRDWLLPCMAGKFQNHSHPLWFKFTKNEGKTVMHYKDWKDQPWEPRVVYGADGKTVARLDSLGLVCLEVIYILHAC